MASACARDLNDELTVILSSLEILRLEDPGCLLLLDIESAALRSTAKVATLLMFASAPLRASLEFLAGTR